MKKYMIKVNGEAYEVEVEEIVEGGAAVTAPTPKAKKKASTGSSNEVVAPMPGTVLKINVKEGEEVKADQVVLILEAMKMENEIKAPKAGKIASIEVDETAPVGAGDVLITIE